MITAQKIEGTFVMHIALWDFCIGGFVAQR